MGVGGNRKNPIPPDDGRGMSDPGQFCFPNDVVRRTPGTGNVSFAAGAVEAWSAPAGPVFSERFRLRQDGRCGERQADRYQSSDFLHHELVDDVAANSEQVKQFIGGSRRSRSSRKSYFPSPRPSTSGRGRAFASVTGAIEPFPPIPTANPAMMTALPQSWPQWSDSPSQMTARKRPASG